MKATFRKKVLTGVGVMALAGGTLLATAGSALATVPTTISNDPGATLGGIDFFNSAGVQITSGPLTAPFAAYAVAQNAPSTPPSFKKMVANAYTPVFGQLPANWSGEQLAHASTAYPVATPASLASLSTNQPVYTGAANDKSLLTYIGDFPNNDTSTTDGYKGIYVIRIQEATTGDYARADIFIDTTAGTWTQQDGTFQAFPDTTTTTLTPTPGSPSVPSTVVTLSAHVADTTTPATVAAGTVAFFDAFTGSPVQIGTTQTVDGSGNASVSWTSTTALGTHPLTAVFTPATPANQGTSTGSSSYIIANLDSTNTALSVTPGATTAFAPEDIKAIVTDTTTPASIPTGTVNFSDGSTPIGSAPVNGSGVAEIPAYTGFAQGPHSVTAVFVPSAGSVFAGSNGGPVTFTNTAPACPNGESPTLCVDQQTVQATVLAGTITITTPYTPTNPLNLGNLVLNSSGTLLSASAAFGNTSNPQLGGSEIFVTDTRAGNPNWTATVDAGAFTSGSNSIDGQYAGLTGVTAQPVSGNALTAANVTVTQNPAGSTGIVAGGNQGIGGTVAGTPGNGHVFANTTAGGDGSIGFTGTFTLNAPTSTAAGLYTGTVTFTVG